MIEGWIRLSNEIVMRCCADYAQYLNRLEALRNRPVRRGPDPTPELLGKIEACEVFFRSIYGATICPDCDLERMMGLVRTNRKLINRKWRMLQDSNEWRRGHAGKAKGGGA